MRQQQQQPRAGCGHADALGQVDAPQALAVGTVKAVQHHEVTETQAVHARQLVVEPARLHGAGAGQADAEIQRGIGVATSADDRVAARVGASSFSVGVDEAWLHRMARRGRQVI